MQSAGAVGIYDIASNTFNTSDEKRATNVHGCHGDSLPLNSYNMSKMKWMSQQPPQSPTFDEERQ